MAIIGLLGVLIAGGMVIAGMKSLSKRHGHHLDSLHMS